MSVECKGSHDSRGDTYSLTATVDADGAERGSSRQAEGHQELRARVAVDAVRVAVVAGVPRAS